MSTAELTETQHVTTFLFYTDATFKVIARNKFQKRQELKELVCINSVVTLHLCTVSLQ